MGLEYYLIEEKEPIIAIARISKILDDIIRENYKNNDKAIKEEILGLNTAIRMIAFCMRYRRQEYYNQIDENYNEDFSYNSVMYEDL